MNAIQEQLKRFVNEARESPQHLAFILDNLGSSWAEGNLDAASLEHVQTVYQRIQGTKDSVDAEWRENLLHVLPLFIGELIVQATDADWVPETRKSLLHQGPYRVTGFGDMDWETYYPAMARQMIMADPTKITSIYAASMEVWNLRCAIIDGVVECFAACSQPQTISDIVSCLETAEIAPAAHLGAARHKQFAKRVLTLVRRDSRFRKIPETNDTFEFNQSSNKRRPSTPFLVRDKKV